jgi:PKD repeat protein
VISRRVNNCCGFEVKYDSIIVRGKPVANFAVLPDSGCTPMPVLFQLDGLIKGVADSAQISFGDGQSIRFQPNRILQGNKYIYQWGQKTHLYQYGGFNDTTYTATLTVYNSCGDSSISKSIYLQANTVQAFLSTNKTQGCAPLTVQFTNLSFNYTSASWCFNYNGTACTGAASVLTNPSWTFTTPGTYTVALFVNNGCGYDTTLTTINVFPSPNVTASANGPKCIGEDIQFTSSGSMSGGGLLAYTWNFGDGGSSFLSSPIHAFNTSGTKLVRVYVQSANGCVDSSQITVIVNPSPAVDFSFNTNCINNQPIAFTNLSTIALGSIATFSWNFGDGNTSNAQSPTHTYAAAGTYKITLIAMSNNGCIDSASKLLILHPIPNPLVQPLLTGGDSCSVPQTYTFQNTTQNATGDYWDFHYNGQRGVFTSALKSPSFTYQTAGIYTVAYFAQNAFGCGDTLFIPLVIRDGVEVDLTVSPLEGCAPLTVTAQFNVVVNPQLDTVDQFIFYPGDGSRILTTQTNFTHTYTIPGKFVPSVVVKTKGNCTDSTHSADTVTVHPKPSVDFEMVKLNWRKIQFNNLTNPIGGNTYSWDFGDGAKSTDLSPSHEYLESLVGEDTLVICLAATNAFGCADTLCKPLWLWKAQLAVPNAFSPDLDYVGDDNVFAPKGHSLGTYRLEIYDKWGNMVYRTDAVDADGIPTQPWNGRYMNNGDPLPMGAYVWKIYAVFNDGTRWVGQEDVFQVVRDFGTVTLLR